MEDPESQTTKNLALISLRHGRSQGQKQKAWRSVWKWDRPNLKDILDCFIWWFSQPLWYTVNINIWIYICIYIWVFHESG
jgi:hypothetical protein